MVVRREAGVHVAMISGKDVCDDVGVEVTNVWICIDVEDRGGDVVGFA